MCGTQQAENANQRKSIKWFIVRSQEKRLTSLPRCGDSNLPRLQNGASHTGRVGTPEKKLTVTVFRMTRFQQCKGGCTIEQQIANDKIKLKTYGFHIGRNEAATSFVAWVRVLVRAFVAPRFKGWKRQNVIDMETTMRMVTRRFVVM